MNICLFSIEEIKKPLPIGDVRAEHLIRVLHKQKGDAFAAGIIGGAAGTAIITGIKKPDAHSDGYITFNFSPEKDGKPLHPLQMIIGFPRPIQLKRLLRDMAGLGVSAVHITGTELGEKSYMHSSLVQRGSARQMLLDGTMQAGSTHLPDLYTYSTLAECIERQTHFLQDAVLIALDNARPKVSLTHFASTHALHKVAAAIGSERGWTDNERDLLEKAGFVLCGMGERIFRTETAATVAASIILSKMGALE